MKNFLLVSGSAKKHHLITQTLQKAGGYRLRIATTPEDAQGLVRHGDWDVIFFDYFLGDQDTIPLIEEARTNFPLARMTAFYHDHHCFVDMKEAGCDFELDSATPPTVLEELILSRA